MLYVWQRLLKVRLNTFQKPNILQFQDFKILSSQGYIIDAFPWIIFILAGLVLQGQHSLRDENDYREQLMVMEGRWPPEQQVTGFHWALMFWETSCDQGLSLWEFWWGLSSFSDASRHSLGAHSTSDHSLSFVERCWGKAFCLTCQESASNGSFSVSSHSKWLWSLWNSALQHLQLLVHTEEQTLYLYLALLWKTGLECLCISAQYVFPATQYI